MKPEATRQAPWMAFATGPEEMDFFAVFALERPPLLLTLLVLLTPLHTDGGGRL